MTDGRGRTAKLQPHYLKKMLDVMTASQAAALMGCSAGNLTGVIRDGEGSAVWEKFAELWWHSQMREEAKARRYVLTIAEKEHDTVVDLLNRFNTTLTELP